MFPSFWSVPCRPAKTPVTLSCSYCNPKHRRCHVASTPPARVPSVHDAKYSSQSPSHRPICRFADHRHKKHCPTLPATKNFLLSVESAQKQFRKIGSCSMRLHEKPSAVLPNTDHSGELRNTQRQAHRPYTRRALCINLPYVRSVHPPTNT